MKLAFFGVAALAAAASATPALAQVIISSPGYCMTASCWGYRTGNLHTDGGYYRNDKEQNSMAMLTVDNNAYRYHGGPKYND